MASIKRKRISDDELIELINAGKFKVDCHAAIVTRCNGLQIAVRWIGGKRQYRAVVELCHNFGKRTILLHKLVWMDFYRRTVPEGFEIHHGPGGNKDNSIENLLCVFGKDHPKLHRSYIKEVDEEPIPD